MDKQLALGGRKDANGRRRTGRDRDGARFAATAPGSEVRGTSALRVKADQQERKGFISGSGASNESGGIGVSSSAVGGV